MPLDMANLVKIIECPRDAWQGLHGRIPAELKTKYLRKLIDAGFKQIDAVSFVSPSAVPQMADSEEVLESLKPDNDVEIIGIVVNAKGAERAMKTGAVRTLGFPYSISAKFLMRNQNQTTQEALATLEAIGVKARSASLGLVAYISMAFGNPYDDAWSAREVVDACRHLRELGVRQISLADTVGLATHEGITDTFAAVLAAHGELEIGAHLHARRDEAGEKIRAAYEAGCRRFDSAIGGLGGCPFAQDDLVGNLPTETLMETLEQLGAQMSRLGSLDGLIQESLELSNRFGTATS